jgi:hypothetical protein
MNTEFRIKPRVLPTVLRAALPSARIGVWVDAV